MAFTVNYNEQAMFTHWNLKRTEGAISKNLEKLATGQRVNRAADDAAGYYIANQLKTYSKSLEQGTRNAMDGISLAQTAQGALHEVYDILNDVKTKAIQAANTQDKKARGSLQEDINKLADAIDKIFRDTEFNNLKVFDHTSEKTSTSFNIQYGGRYSQKLLIEKKAAIVAVGTSSKNSSQVKLDGKQYSLNVQTVSQANGTIKQVDDLIKEIDKMASYFGSKQIELEKIVSNNRTQKLNTDTAESRIRNIDFAQEMAEFTKNNILMQSGTAMLAQANQQSQLVMQLLR